MKHVWYRPGSLGDCMMTLHLVKNFKEKHPEAELIYRCDPVIERVLRDLILSMGFSRIETGPPEKGDIHLVGYPINRLNPKRGHPYTGKLPHHLIKYFADELGVEPDFESFILPLPTPVLDGEYVTMQVKTGWSIYKDWGYEKFNELAWRLGRSGIRVIQVGGPNDPDIPNAFGKIKTTDGPDNPRVHFNTCLSAIAHSKLHIGLDSWGNHATSIKWQGADGFLGRTHGVIMWGSSQMTATGYPCNDNISANLPCSPCFKETPGISDTPLEPCPIKHACMAEITVDQVYKTVINLLEGLGEVSDVDNKTNVLQSLPREVLAPPGN